MVTMVTAVRTSLISRKTAERRTPTRSPPPNKALLEGVITSLRDTNIPNRGSRRRTPEFRPCHSRTYMTIAHIDKFATDTDPSPNRILVEEEPVVLTDPILTGLTASILSGLTGSILTERRLAKHYRLPLSLASSWLPPEQYFRVSTYSISPSFSPHHLQVAQSFFITVAATQGR